ncbi:MAG TPA: phosphomethylpyrimidine synthase ThiC [Candidatus Aminicenantes bacterium]|nr:phosphomethylpyrimidine synthase ThiC [Candidatus Aminicenantes bacterium]
MTQLERAKKGEITPEMQSVAKEEQIKVDELVQLMASGRVVIPFNPAHKNIRVIGIGEKLRTKVNVNIGTSGDFPLTEEELKKVDICLKYGTDTIMDLSTGGDIRKTRQAILKKAPFPLGTVPIYETAIKAIDQRGAIVQMTTEDIFQVIEDQAKEGVDFMTVHVGLTSKAVERLKNQGRVADIVSRGGAFHLAWILHHQQENPLYEHFDRLLDIAQSYDITLSLGDGLRPGAIADATDRPQIEELLTLGELVQRAREAGVQVMVEGPGHVPLDQIEMNIKLQKRLCQGAPFYVLGPLVTDIAPGYDHIVSAIGGAIAGAAGADFLCYVTPSEHLGLPSADDVREGLIASKIAAHAADLVKGVPGAWERDRKLSQARKKLDWLAQKDLVIDPVKFDEIRLRRKTSSTACSMCGEFCAMKIVSEFLDGGSKVDVPRC